MKLLNCDIFGENLKQIRKSCNLTQEETVAKLQTLGSPLSRSTYSLIESGRGNIFISDLVGLHEVFGVEYSEFFKNISTDRRENNSLTHTSKIG